VFEKEQLETHEVRHLRRVEEHTIDGPVIEIAPGMA
jgi:hypothetical protein